MEKEEKGLFRRLMDFWREKISGEETDGIGFWNKEMKQENHFAEMGAVDTLSREEVKKVFWDGEDEWMEKKQQKAEKFFEKSFEDRMELSEENEKKPMGNTERQVDFFTSEILGADDREEQHVYKMGKMFFSDTEEKETRMIIPIAEETKQEKVLEEEWVSESERIVKKKAEKTAEPTIDIENLMRQITRRLWEEREGCGRRLR